MKQSEFGSINLRDLANGLVLAVISGVLTMLGDSFAKGNFTFTWPAIWHVAATVAVSYLVHQFTKGESPTQSNA